MYEPTPTLLTFARATKLPCTTFAHAFVCSYMGKEPTTARLLPHAWVILDVDLYKAISIFNKLDHWSGPRAVAKATGNPVVEVAPGESVTWEPGVWYFVQRWDEHYGLGHAYIVQGARDGGHPWLYESGRGRGFRVSRRFYPIPPSTTAQVVRLGA